MGDAMIAWKPEDIVVSDEEIEKLIDDAYIDQEKWLVNPVNYDIWRKAMQEFLAARMPEKKPENVVGLMFPTALAVTAHNVVYRTMDSLIFVLLVLGIVWAIAWCKRRPK
jgi:hypothetical protein